MTQTLNSGTSGAAKAAPATRMVGLTINGRAVQARAGQTVLQAAQAVGIDIPALCNFPKLHPEGACRVCLVEIEKQRTLQPACTFPVAEGLVVQTESEKVVAARKFALEMIFSERSHYCMYCPASGTDHSTDCELQKLGYRYGLTHWPHEPNYSRKWPIDASRKHFMMDHSRCILCRRCVRACHEIAANHTLGVHQRGARTMVCADDDVAFGGSSCVSCGTCLQVCPTGALLDKRSVYLGHETDVRRSAATCMGCSVGCGVEVLTRDNVLVRVEGDWNAANGGLLCAEGRFEVAEPKPPRILWPMVRSDGKLVETNWDKALTQIAARLQECRRTAGLVSPRMTNETLAAFACFFNEVLQSSDIGLLYGESPATGLGAPATLADVADADCIVLIGASPLDHQKVVGYMVKRAYDHEAKIIVVNDTPTGLEAMASVRLQMQNIARGESEPFERLKFTYHLRMDGVAKVRSSVEMAQRPVVLYGPGLSTTVHAAMRALPAKAKFLPLAHGANAVGAARLGITTRPVHGELLYVLAGDDMPAGDQPLPAAKFTVVQAAYPSAWTEKADVVLPARIWTERSGHVVNTEGRTLTVAPVQDAPKTIHADWATLLMLSVRVGYPLPYDAIPDISMAL